MKKQNLKNQVVNSRNKILQINYTKQKAMKNSNLD